MNIYNLSEDLDYGTPCYDCGGKNEPYMLKDRIWNKLVPEENGEVCICLTCIQTRLMKTENRALKLSDFLLGRKKLTFVELETGEELIRNLNPISFGYFELSVLDIFKNAEVVFTKNKKAIDKPDQ
jgi:hypothetical protein